MGDDAFCKPASTSIATINGEDPLLCDFPELTFDDR